MSGYAIRAARRDDLRAVARLMRAADLADYGLSVFTEADVAEDWARPRFVVERDCLVVESRHDASLAAYGYVWDRDEGTHIIEVGVVHPDHRGRGIGSRLLDAMEALALERAAGATGMVISSVVPSEDRTARELVASRGYAFARRFWRMAKELTASDDVAVGDPTGTEITATVPGENDEVIHALMEETFRDNWRPQSEQLDEWRDRRLMRGSPVWLIAREAGEIGGALVGWVEGELGRVDELGVLERWRRRGIGEALLRHAFARFARTGASIAELYVDSENETGATALYERVGMRSTLAYSFFDKTSG